MQPLKISGLILLVAVAVIYAGMKAYVYFSVKEQLDRAVMQMRPFAALGYGGISSNLGSGTLTVHDIEIDAGEQSPALRIGLLDVAGPGPCFLFFFGGGGGGGWLTAGVRGGVGAAPCRAPRRPPWSGCACGLATNRAAAPTGRLRAALCTFVHSALALPRSVRTAGARHHRVAASP